MRTFVDAESVPLDYPWASEAVRLDFLHYKKWQATNPPC